MRALPLVPLLVLAACKPPAADGYVERVDLAKAGPFASDPLPSPDTAGALWAQSATAGQIIYGQPGKPPLVALACARTQDGASIRLTRYSPADPEAQAFAALIGNSHMLRLPVDAVREGQLWIWRGEIPAGDTRLEALTGAREVELTIPGAGTTVLNPSSEPAQLIDRCRGTAALPLPAPPATPQ